MASSKKADDAAEATYTVGSELCSLGDIGDTVSGDALKGLNVAALIKGGHLIDLNAKKKE